MPGKRFALRHGLYGRFEEGDDASPDRCKVGGDLTNLDPSEISLPLTASFLVGVEARGQGDRPGCTIHRAAPRESGRDRCHERRSIERETRTQPLDIEEVFVAAVHPAEMGHRMKLLG